MKPFQNLAVSKSMTESAAKNIAMLTSDFAKAGLALSVLWPNTLNCTGNIIKFFLTKSIPSEDL
jgi:uncharacterized protein (UPF0333 family)